VDFTQAPPHSSIRRALIRAKTRRSPARGVSVGPLAYVRRELGDPDLTRRDHLAQGSIQMIESLGQVALTVRDVERSMAFYRDAVGLRFLFAPMPTLAFLMIGDVRLMLSTPEGEFTPGGSTVLYLRVSDIEAEHSALSARGVAFIDAPHLVARMPDHELWMCFFRDPDGHTLALMCERPLAA
jgi:methylmalonyl-CoA/ethylmalonyl-CoA epimerase